MIHYNATFRASTYQDAEKLFIQTAAQAGFRIMEVISVDAQPELMRAATKDQKSVVVYYSFEFRAEVTDGGCGSA